MSKFKIANASLFTNKAKIRRCYLGKVLYVLSQTSNWTGPCGFRTEHLDSLHLDINAAVTWINLRRRSPKAWYIWQLPIVVIESHNKEKLLISELSWISPLSDYDFELPAKKTFGNLAESLMPACRSEQYGLQCEDDIQPAEFPFISKRTPNPDDRQAAKVWGDPVPKRMVDWMKDRHTDAQPAIRIVYKICLWLADEK